MSCLSVRTLLQSQRKKNYEGGPLGFKLENEELREDIKGDLLLKKM